MKCRICKAKFKTPHTWPIRCCHVIYRHEGDQGSDAGSWPQYEGPCIHQGDELRRELCNSCKAQVLIKIFACSIHGECSLKAGMGVKCCKACGDYVANSSAHTADTDEAADHQRQAAKSKSAEIDPP